MSIYILENKTYETFPKLKNNQPEDAQDLSTIQLQRLALTLSEHFGCFLLFGMSLQGEPRMLLSGTSGMEHLALKKFAEDVILGEGAVSVVPLDEIDDDEE